MKNDIGQLNITTLTEEDWEKRSKEPEEIKRQLYNLIAIKCYQMDEGRVRIYLCILFLISIHRLPKSQTPYPTYPIASHNHL